MKTLMIVMFASLNACFAQPNLMVKYKYDSVCFGGFSKDGKMIIDSCNVEHGEFEFEKSFIKHNTITYIVEYTEPFDSTGYALGAMGPNFTMYLFILHRDEITNKKIIYISDELSSVGLKYRLYYPTESKTYIRLNEGN